MSKKDTKPTGADLVGTEDDRGVHQKGSLSRYSTTERDQLRALAGLDEASDGDIDMLAAVSQRTGLDPFLKEIYLVGRKTKTGGYRGEPERWETKWTVQAGIDGFRKVLFRVGEKTGMSHEIGAPIFIDQNGEERRVWLKQWGYPAAALVDVRLGDSVGHGIATWDEFVQTKRDGKPNSMWEKMGPTMLAKCAEAQAHRKVNSLTAGMYVSEEMHQANNHIEEAVKVETQGRGSSGLRAALGQAVAIEAAPADEPSELLQIASSEIQALDSRDAIKAAMEAYQSDLPEKEYEVLRELGLTRWNELSKKEG